MAPLGRTIYVAGGLTTSGATNAIYAVSLDGTVKRIGKLPAPEDHAALAALGGTLYLIGRQTGARDRPRLGEGDDA